MELKEELINFAKWYQMDEMARDEPEPFSEIVDRYLERFGKKPTKGTSNCNIPPVIKSVCSECGAAMKYDWIMQYNVCEKCGCDKAN